MGLTIQYRIDSRCRTQEQAERWVRKIHQICLDLPFEEVDEVVVLKGDRCDYSKLDPEDPYRWMAIHGAQYIDISAAMDSILPRCMQGYNRSMSVPADCIIGFTAYPGDGCEPFNVYIATYPKTVEIDSRSDCGMLGSSKTVRTKLRNWIGRGFVKTQYASEFGPKHFLRCHKAVIAALDAMGAKAEVDDEGGYWQKRDDMALLKEVGEWNVLIAETMAQMKSAFGGQVVGAMDDDPKTEQYEAKATDAHREYAAKMVEALEQLVSAEENNVASN